MRCLVGVTTYGSECDFVFDSIIFWFGNWVWTWCFDNITIKEFLTDADVEGTDIGEAVQVWHFNVRGDAWWFVAQLGSREDVLNAAIRVDICGVIFTWAGRWEWWNKVTSTASNCKVRGIFAEGPGRCLVFETGSHTKAFSQNFSRDGFCVFTF